MIIVFDDEPGFAGLIVSILQNNGFRDVVGFQTYEGLVEAANKSDLVITDMSGHAHILCKIKSPMITMSGDETNKPDLPKPFKSSDLIELVRRELIIKEIA